MANCNIFSKPLFQDIDDLDNFDIDISWLKNLIPTNNSLTSGLWLPIIVSGDNSDINFLEIFQRADSEKYIFDPCNCTSNTDSIDNEDPENSFLDCTYCYKDGQNYTFSWSLEDKQSEKQSSAITSDCCSGACDIRLTKDDYLTKLPVLNSSYIKSFYDFKYKNQFPACSNKSLGKESFASISTAKLKSFKAGGPKLSIDWKIKERISEISPNDIDTYHDTIDAHEKSYNRSLLTSKTCGNFLLTKLHPSSSGYPAYPALSGLIGTIAMTGDFSKILPSVDNYTKPYGFKNKDYYNIFVKTEKLGSYWKWNYNSGILCWYRYHDTDLEENQDNRLIKGVDLYISDGDVFYASSDGPESNSTNLNNDPADGEVKPCPSGLKLIQNNSVTGVIPSGSDFIYISENLYGKTISILNRLDDLEESLDIADNQKMSPIDKLHLASLLATGPNYHEVTVDLLKVPLNASGDYNRDIYKQIIVFNSGMLTKQQHTANKLNIVKTKQDLVNTLANKYGCYLWFPPNSTTSLSLKEKHPSHCYMDLDFEPVVEHNKTFFSSSCGTQSADCLVPITERNFSYDQSIKVGELNLYTSANKKYKSHKCINGNLSTDKTVDILSVYINSGLIKEQIYGTGCSELKNKYVRAPSYELAVKALGEKICEQDGLCDETLAYKYDLDPGYFDDKSFLMLRKYPANTSNINIDRVGFHKDGGVYYDSNSLGTGVISFLKNTTNAVDVDYTISFVTKDIGIKLYSIDIFKLRDRDNPTCKTFPLDQPCKCFPLTSVSDYRHNCDGSLTFTNKDSVLYTPNLSTHSSPLMKSYGGYSAKELSEVVGSETIPNHPAVMSNLPVVDRIVDPLHPYGCTKQISVSFPNYVYSKWSINLPHYSTDHADVWMSLNENINLFNPTLPVFDNDLGEFETISNSSYRRYATEALVNGEPIYHLGQKILFSKDNSISSFDIELTNPFLYALLSTQSIDIEKNKFLYTTTSCSLGNHTLDTYLNNITLTFKQIPRKQVLSYRIPPIASLGSLTETFFHPNSGLMYDEELLNKTSLTFNNQSCAFDFMYEKTLFGGSYGSSGLMFEAELSDKVKSVLSLNNNLLTHKKLRLYLLMNGGWYEYSNPHMFGFYNTNNDQAYPGPPIYFEYCDLDNSRISFPSPFISTSVKTNTEFLYIHNARPTGLSNATLSDNYYPIFHGSFIKKNDKSIMLPGSRAYFMFAESDPALLVNTIADLKNSSTKPSPIMPFVLETGSPVHKRLKLKNNISSNYDSYDSYEIIPARSYIDNNNNELWIDYNNTTSDGLILGTNKSVIPTPVELIDINNNARSLNVVKKSLYAKKSDKFGNEINIFDISKDREHLDVFTVLDLDLCQNCKLPVDNGFINFSMPSVKNSSTNSFVVLQNLKGLVRNEPNSLLRNQIYDTKWGDVLSFDHTTYQDISNSPFLRKNLELYYPSSLYDNVLYSISINNLNESGQFFIASRGASGNHTGVAYYNIHQKYNIGLDNTFVENTVSNYQNYLPIIDINFLGSGIKNQPFYENIKNDFTNNRVSTGLIYISGIRSFVDSSVLRISPKAVSKFFISLDKNQKLKPVLFDQSFYNDTLRVDDVYYRLAKLTKEETFANCNKVFKPQFGFFNSTQSQYFNFSNFKTNEVKTTFLQAPIYCDTDRAGSFCGNGSCSFSTVGVTKLKADYHIHDYNYISIDDENKPTAFAISVDEGLYNPIGISGLPYIQRFEIPPPPISTLFSDNTFYENVDCMSYVRNRPHRPQTYIDIEYQSELEQYKVDPSTQSVLVKNTDILANEMLFRLIYGSKQKISYDTIKKKTITDIISFNNKKSISYLVQYANIRTTPERIYELIPYDYSSLADVSKRKINGSISINGVLTIGAQVSIDIGGYGLTIKIQKIDGKVCAVASCNGESYVSSFFNIETVSESLTAVKVGTTLYPADQNSTIRPQTVCLGGLSSKSWTINRYYKNMKITPGEGETPIAIDQQMIDECIENPSKGEWPVRILTTVPGVAGPNGCEYLTHSCSPRGYAAGPTVPSNCSIVDENSGSITLDGKSRGTFAYDSCPPRNASISTSPALNIGDFEDLVGGIPVRNHGVSYNCAPQVGSCKGSCTALDGEDNYGPIHDPARYLNQAYTNACECAPYSYGYCTIATTPCGCQQYGKNYPNIFNYEFEYCNYKFNNIKGHLYKFEDGDTPVSNGISQTSECTYFEQLESKGGMTGEATEYCYWLECVGPPNDDYSVSIIKTITTADYNPSCPTYLCDIAYDNNTITIDLVGGLRKCFSISLREVCPEISITLPNNTFTFTDTINSECTECDVAKNTIDMPETIQPWDIITETKTMILGYLPIEGNMNKDVVGAGRVYVPKGTCGTAFPDCCYDSCYTVAFGGAQCGMSAPGSWPWGHALLCHLPGSPSPSLSNCISNFKAGAGTNASILVNAGVAAGFATGSDNESVRNRVVADWKERMREAYMNIAPCHNSHADDFNINDLVEGVIPGSCGEVSFKVLNYPMIGWRQTMEGGETQDGTYGVHVAYFTYSYKRPRTIQDVLLGDNATPCSTRLAYDTPYSYNITEKYKIENCQTTPSCSDTASPAICDDGNICCRANQLNPSITSRS